MLLARKSCRWILLLLQTLLVGLGVLCRAKVGRLGQLLTWGLILSWGGWLSALSSQWAHSDSYDASGGVSCGVGMSSV